MNLELEFENAIEAVKGLPKQSNDGLLRLYSLFKQANDGDVSGKRPGMLDVRGRAKYDAWKSLEGMNSDLAKQEYIDYVKQLGGNW